MIGEGILNHYIALDVGGTNVSSSVVSSDGKFILPVIQNPAYSNRNKTTIINNFMKIINEQLSSAHLAGIPVDGIGIGFPGPFDYKSGISLMKGIGKYESLYGINIKEELQGRLADTVDIRFCNDADLYCLGECVFGVGKNFSRCMCVCIGTGIGSGFFADGRLIKKGNTVPENGWIYAIPCRGGIADEYLSATGLLKMMKEYPETSLFHTVYELAQAARAGLPQATCIFQDFGELLYDVIAAVAVKFNADCLILGGQVSRSHDLFDKKLAEGLAQKHIQVLPSSAFSDNTLLACSLLFR